MCVLNVAASAAIMDGRTKAVLNTSALLKPVLEQFTTLEQATQGHTETHHTHSHTLHTYAVHTHTHTHTHTATSNQRLHSACAYLGGHRSHSLKPSRRIGDALLLDEWAMEMLQILLR
jgi:hypothetical protein